MYEQGSKKSTVKDHQVDELDPESELYTTFYKEDKAKVTTIINVEYNINLLKKVPVLLKALGEESKNDNLTCMIIIFS